MKRGGKEGSKEARKQGRTEGKREGRKGRARNGIWGHGLVGLIVSLDANGQCSQPRDGDYRKEVGEK